MLKKLIKLIKKLRKNTKGVVGIGILIIFISTILVSAIAAGVLIQTSGLLQQRAIKVEDDIRNRLVTGVDVFQLTAIANTSSETVYAIELLVRPDAGSYPVPMDEARITFNSVDTADIQMVLNTSYVGSNCTLANLNNQSQYCIEPIAGDSNVVLEEGELHIIRFELNSTNFLAKGEDFQILVVPRIGKITRIDTEVPGLIISSNVRITI